MNQSAPRARPLYLDVQGSVGPELALFHPPVPAAIGGRLGVVLCPPHGWDYTSSYRSLRRLAVLLAEAGIPVVRFDYHGTGNAAGDDTDPDRVSAWKQSTHAAIDALKQHAAIESVVVIGVRLGALLGAIVASERSDVDAVVLWAPVRSGKAYTREMHMMRLAEVKNLGGPDTVLDGARGGMEAGGFTLSAQTIADLATLDLATLKQRPAAQVLIVHRDDLIADERLVRGLVKTGANVTQMTRPGYGAMMQSPHFSVAPEPLYADVIEWLRALQPAPSAPAHAIAPSLGSAVARFIDRDGGFEEEAIYLDGGQRIFGVVTHPLGPMRDAPVLVILNAGGVYHVGPNRMFVGMARRWARLGFRTLRVDLTGVGESDTDKPAEQSHPYAPHLLADIRTIIDEIHRRWSRRRIVIMGICSGAVWSFKSALERLPIDTAILINPPFFYWHDGDTLEDTPSKVYEGVEHYRRSLFSLEKWKKALTGQVQYRRLAELMVMRGATLAKDLLVRVARQVGIRTAEDLSADLNQIVASGTRVEIVFSEGDAGVDYLLRGAAHGLPKLERRPDFRIGYVANADHTFTDRDARARFDALLTGVLLRLFPT